LIKTRGCLSPPIWTSKTAQWNIFPSIWFLLHRLEDQAMTQYGDDRNNRIVDENTGMPLGQASYEEEKVLADERRSVSLWGVLAAGILVILIAAGSFAIWPSATHEPASTASTTPAINSQVPGAATPDNNPATGSIKPPETMGGNPAPATGTDAPAGATAPSAPQNGQ
jgi:hypothetical protein